MARVFASRRPGRSTPLGITRIALAIAAALAALASPPLLGAAPAPYQLYFSFEIPRALEGMILADEGTLKTYNGTLKGTLGGLALRTATYSYIPNPATGAGGGSCALATAAGEVTNGQILMTTDGNRTTLICAGLYLGTHIEFTIVADGVPIGGIGVTATGLALTGFHSHDEYMAAIRTAITPLPPEVRAQALSQADTNPRLVSAYEQRLPR